MQKTVSPRLDRPVEWLVTPGLVDYEAACTFMEARVNAIATGQARELIWLIEHPPLYTAGTSARGDDLIEPNRLPVFRSGRGGQHTYHGPGQRVVYVMLDVGARFGDVRAFVTALEAWSIEALAGLGVAGVRIPGRVGVWVRRSETDAPSGQRRHDKIAAIGVRLRRWVSWHGLSINVAPDLEHYRGIVPCGIRDDGVTSLADLGVRASLQEVDEALRAAFARHFAGAEAPQDGLVDASRTPMRA